MAERIDFRPMKWLARRAQVIATISHVEKMRLVRRGYGKEGSIEVLHPGVSDRFKPLEDIALQRREEVRSRFGLPPRYLLYLGRLNVRKNILTLLNALTCLNDRDHSSGIGREQPTAQGGDIEAEIRRLGLAERIICTGYVATATFLC